MNDDHATTRPTAAPAVPPTPDTALLQFLFDKRLALFNTRRDHEWRVLFGAMVLIGAVDAGLLTNRIRLDAAGVAIWCVTLAALFAIVTAYQFGVQTRNRVDRVAMDAIYSELCDVAELPADSDVRVGIDRADPRLGTIGHGIFQRTFLWAFGCQTLLLLAGCLLSAALPLVIDGAFQSAAPAPAPTSPTPAAGGSKP